MINKEEFRQWLAQNTQHSEKAIRDVVSRMNRVDSIIEWSDNASETYLFYLEQNKQFLELTASVKSQLRRSVRLYKEYLESLA